MLKSGLFVCHALGHALCHALGHALRTLNLFEYAVIGHP